MKTKMILIGILSLVTLVSFAQNNINGATISKSAVTVLKLETNNLSELKDIDWNMVEDIFEDNDKDQNITLAFGYTNKSEADASSTVINNFSIEFKGKSSDLKDLIDKSKKQIQRLVELNDTNKN
jgi:hypothetical protein